MSKGYGITMRRVLADLDDEWRTMRDLASTDKRAAIESTRRACKRLAAQGLVDLDYWHHDRDDAALWSSVIAEQGYEPDARPAHPIWQLVARRRKEGNGHATDPPQA